MTTKAPVSQPQLARLKIRWTQQAAAEDYACLLVLKDGLLTPVRGYDTEFWHAYNQRIIDRWGMAGLKRVKHKAWKIAAERTLAGR